FSRDRRRLPENLRADPAQNRERKHKDCDEDNPQPFHMLTFCFTKATGVIWLQRSPASARRIRHSSTRNKDFVSDFPRSIRRIRSSLGESGRTSIWGSVTNSCRISLMSSACVRGWLDSCCANGVCDGTAIVAPLPDLAALTMSGARVIKLIVKPACRIRLIRFLLFNAFYQASAP